jgi:cytochrome c oxidase cbb3-type subunit 2
MLSSVASAAFAKERPAPDSAAGEAAYQQSCARCHGDTGQGDGLDAKRFYPRPRDLATGIYKFRSTASGTPPTDEDLFHTITYGLPGSNMPDWQHLSEDTRWQLVYYLKRLSPIFEQTPPAPLTLPPDPGDARDPAKGKALYTQLGCVACHGEEGRANGPSAAGLVDDWGMPMRPANLTLGWNYRGGAAPRDIAMRLWAGIDGAGMPSYAEAIAPDDAWRLAHYVASLQEPAHWRAIVRAARATGELPESADDPRWASAEQGDILVRNVVTPEGAWTQPPTIRMVSLRALHTDEAVALHLTWDDPTEESTGDAVDSLALAMKPADAEGDVVTLQAWPYEGAPALDFTVWSAGAPAAAALVAADVEGLQTAPGASLPASGTYQRGRRRLVIRRPLQPPAEGAAAIAPNGLTSMAVVVWDGGNPGTRAVSAWIDLSLGDVKRTHAASH